jgi:hypothetical protein
MGFTQRPWTPTKRRGPIAAEHNSPGPACVALKTTIGELMIHTYAYFNFFSNYVEADLKFALILN